MKKEFTPLVYSSQHGYDSSLPTISPDNVFSTIKRKIEHHQEYISKSNDSSFNAYLLGEIRALENLYFQITSDFHSSNCLELTQLVKSFEEGADLK